MHHGGRRRDPIDVIRDSHAGPCRRDADRTCGRHRRREPELRPPLRHLRGAPGRDCVEPSFQRDHHGRRNPGTSFRPGETIQGRFEGTLEVLAGANVAAAQYRWNPFRRRRLESAAFLDTRLRNRRRGKLACARTAATRGDGQATPSRR
jgi:hypothetical protein